MATFVIDDIALPSGILKTSFINNDGDSATYYLPSDRLLKIGRRNAVAEESGFGGILKIGDAEIELFDKDNDFRNRILTDSVTSLQAKILLTIGVTDFPVIYGDVDIETVEQPSYYDNEDMVESHSVKFIVFDILKRLENISISTLIGNLDALKVSGTGTVLYNYDQVNHSGTIFSSDFTNPFGGIAWSSAYFAGYSDNFYANVTLAANQISKYLLITGFNFAIPSTNTIVGIKVEVERSIAAVPVQLGVIKDNIVKLIVGGVVSGTDKADTSTAWTTTDTYKSYNDSFDDTWGLSPTYSQVNASDFGVAISVTNPIGSLGSCKAQIDHVRISIKASIGGVIRYYVKVIDIFDQIQQLFNTEYSLIIGTLIQNDARIYRRLDAFEAATDKSLSDIYIPYQDSSGSYLTLFADGAQGSFYETGNVRDLLKNLCQLFLFVPIMIYTPLTDTFHLKLKQREDGTIYDKDDLGILKESKQGRFSGYDAIRIQLSDSSMGFIYFTRTGETFDISDTVGNNEWDKIQQKFDLRAYMATNETNNVNFQLHIDTGSGYAIVNRVIDTRLPGGFAWQNFWYGVVTNYTRYFQGSKTYERKYRGTGLDFLEIIDRLTIDSEDFTIIEHNADLVENEMITKSVLY